MRLPLICATLIGLLLLCGCGGESDELVLYTSVDEPTARPIVEQFEAETGISVRLVTDTEATKSVGLAERLRAERDRPRADVWWGNEPFHTVRLADEGLFAEHDWPTAADTLDLYRDPSGRWIGNGIRARAIAGTNPADALPATLEALLQAAQGGTPFYLARPTSGTTAGHVAALYAIWGDERADAFFHDLAAAGATLVTGNSHAAQAAANGGIGLTDNDDIANVNRSGGTLTMRLLDQGADGLGTLTIPTTVAVVAKPEVSSDARQLADFLASAAVEQMLRENEFVLASVRESPEAGGVRAMQVNYADVAERLADAPARALAILEGRNP